MANDHDDAEPVAGKPLPTGLRPWKPGQSGNPGGVSKIKREVKELARQSATAAMERIIELMHAGDERVALMAAIEVKNTAIGKPKVRDLTREEIEREVDKRISQLSAEALELRRAGAIEVTGLVPNPPREE